MNRFIYNTKEEFHKYRNTVFVVFVFCMVAVMSFFATRDMNISSAANLNNFNPANIISDAVMGNYNSMTAADIQKFLESKNSCNNRDYNLYLQYTKAHPSITWHWEGEPYNGHFVCLSEEKFGDGEIIGSGMTAAEIIYDAAQKNKINPQVLLVLLQKETGLITDKVPNDLDYRKATGYGCPDTAACDAKYYGFKNQIYRAAELFRYTLDNGYSLYPVGVNVYVGYHPTSSCGGTTIKIENRATAALYRYTPYQPNQAALNAGYGTGDVCSAYGNRNFYLYFTDWFGSTQAAVEGEQITVPDGEYYLISGSSYAMTTTGINNGANVQLAKLNESDANQRWKFERVDGAYKITNVGTGKILDLKNNSASIGGNIQTWERDDTCGQRWKLYRTADNGLVLETVCGSGMMVDVDSRVTDGANVQLGIFSKNSSSQKWSLRAGKTIDNGIYTIGIKSDSSKVIDISGHFQDGNNIQLWSANHTAAQQWLITYNSENGYYTIENPNSRKVLDISGTLRDGANIQLWFSNRTCAQQWQIVSNGSSYAIMSACSPGRVIDLSGVIKSGANIQLWHHNGTTAQQWQIAPASAPADGIYTIETNLSAQKVIDLAGNGSTNGENIQIWFANGTAAQEWQITRDPLEGYYTITNPKTGKVFDLANNTPAYGVNVRTWSAKDTCAQKWYIVESSKNNYTLLTTCNTNYALDVSGYGRSGDNIQLWLYNGTAAQQWTFAGVR